MKNNNETVCECGHEQDDHSCAGDVNWAAKPDSSCYFIDEVFDEICECEKYCPRTTVPVGSEWLRVMRS